MAAVGYAGILLALIGAGSLAASGFRAATGRATVENLRVPALAFITGAAIAFVALELALVAHDFSIAYVARNNSSTTPLVFTLASGWAALEGSIALWGLVLAGLTFAVFGRVGSDDGLGAGALAVLGAVGVFFFALMATIANPFELCTRLAGGSCAEAGGFPLLGGGVTAVEGVGANPLLQNHILMAVHPPLLYVGYVGFTVPFAFAISALWRGERGSVWLDRTHRWSLVAWTFLTAGIVLGAWWSYEVLGWGGYWAWDPVENAALLPWLVGTAFIHSAIVQRRRGMLQAWNLVLVISTFGLTILGTFLTRSGVIASVHSFTQSAVGPALLAFLAVSLLASFALFATRVHLVASSPRLDSLASREGAFLANNLLLTLFALTVLIGTLYPLLVEAFSGDQVSVGRPFFDRASIPLSFALLLFLGIGPVTPYRVARFGVVWDRIRVPINAGLIGGAAVVLLGGRTVTVVAAVAIGTFIIAVIVRRFWYQLAALHRSGTGYADGIVKIFRREPGYWGGMVAHVGVALMAVGIATSGALGVRTELRIPQGQSVDFEGYTLTYQGPFQRNEPNRAVEGARILVSRDGDAITVMEPRVHRYPNQRQAVATPDVRTGFTEDLYLSLAANIDDSVVIDAFRFPFIWVLWVGGALVTAGGAYSFVAARSSGRADQPSSDRDLVATS